LNNRDDFCIISTESLEKMESGEKIANEALKAFITINKLLSKATCGNPAKGRK